MGAYDFTTLSALGSAPSINLRNYGGGYEEMLKVRQERERLDQLKRDEAMRRGLAANFRSKYDEDIAKAKAALDEKQAVIDRIKAHNPYADVKMYQDQVDQARARLAATPEAPTQSLQERPWERALNRLNAESRQAQQVQGASNDLASHVDIDGNMDEGYEGAMDKLNRAQAGEFGMSMMPKKPGVDLEAGARMAIDKYATPYNKEAISTGEAGVSEATGRIPGYEKELGEAEEGHSMAKSALDKLMGSRANDVDALAAENAKDPFRVYTEMNDKLRRQQSAAFRGDWATAEPMIQEFNTLKGEVLGMQSNGTKVSDPNFQSKLARMAELDAKIKTATHSTGAVSWAGINSAAINEVQGRIANAQAAKSEYETKTMKSKEGQNAQNYIDGEIDKFVNDRKDVKAKLNALKTYKTMLDQVRVSDNPADLATAVKALALSIEPGLSVTQGEADFFSGKNPVQEFAMTMAATLRGLSAGIGLGSGASAQDVLNKIASETGKGNREIVANIKAVANRLNPALQRTWRIALKTGGVEYATRLSEFAKTNYSGTIDETVQKMFSPEYIKGKMWNRLGMADVGGLGAVSGNSADDGEKESLTYSNKDIGLPDMSTMSRAEKREAYREWFAKTKSEMEAAGDQNDKDFIMDLANQAYQSALADDIARFIGADWAKPVEAPAKTTNNGKGRGLAAKDAAAKAKAAAAAAASQNTTVIRESRKNRLP